LRFLEAAASDWYSFTSPRENGRIADACLAYLSSYSKSPRRAGSEKDLDVFPFLRYASQNWYLHSHRREGNGDVSSELSFLTNPRELRDWLWVHDPAEPSRKAFETARKAEPDSGFIYACLCGLTEVARVLLESGVDVNEQNDHLGSAIRAASYQGHIGTIKLLLAHGADVNMRAGRHPLPIVGAPLEATKLLLEYGANVDAGGKAGGEAYDSAIFSACTLGEIDVVRLLLEHGANIHVVDDDYGSLIQAASSHGHVEVVKLLLSYGADVNADKGMSRTPFELAVDRSDRQLAELLVQAGADADVESLAQLKLNVSGRPTAKVEKFVSGQAQSSSGEPPVIDDMD
jgi:hypothetical protein